MAYEPILEEATVNFTKSFTTINATAAFYGILTNTLTVQIPTGYFLFSLLSFFFLFFAFLPLFKDTAKKANSFPSMFCVSINEEGI